MVPAVLELKKLYRSVSGVNLKANKQIGLKRCKATIAVEPEQRFQYCVSLKAGQKISWSFRVSPRSLGFTGLAWWTSKASSETEAPGEVVIPACSVTREDGDMEASLEVETDCKLMLRWDNSTYAYGKVNTEILTYAIELANKPSGMVTINPCEDYGYLISVKAGQTISWVFSMVNSGEESGICFTLLAWWAPECSDVVAADKLQEEPGEVVVPSAMVMADDGEVDGCLEVTEDGILKMMWDNSQDASHSKAVRYCVDVAFL
eukprot:gnl/TRDRNA2_/TRDRNA2_137713_c0_seq1.p1 gnl/TRDRNA2_/TRDRNA2_137713_c0~~gnl/TRDRNA2_/TRDRNA2_137713_c0_seq1.p1  ORF type:complete len:299 (-),score=57.77 gnl/TRDRNA2_/TRDRNA2_137713_c0_seq1:52-837(-)